MTDQLAEFLNTIAIIGVGIIGWLIKQAVQNLNSTVKKLDETMINHNLRISWLEWELKKEKQNEQ